MGNWIHIEPTKFINTRTGKEMFGVRIWDDYAQTYDNSWDDIPEDDMELLKRVVAANYTIFTDMCENSAFVGKGLFIGARYYERAAIVDILDPENASQGFPDVSASPST